MALGSLRESQRFFLSLSFLTDNLNQYPKGSCGGWQTLPSFTQLPGTPAMCSPALSAGRFRETFVSCKLVSLKVLLKGNFQERAKS